MSNGANRDYFVGIKNQWRREQWNSIDERLQVPKRDATVIYLAGESNLDMGVAIRHGYKHSNMFAVERDMQTFSKLKSTGISPIRGNLFETLHNWKNRDVHVLVADFCGGYTYEVFKLCGLLLYHPCFERCVISINLQAGRDGLGNDDLNKAIHGHHRGQSFVFSIVSGLLHSLARAGRDASMACDDELAKELWSATRPKFLSYKSNVESKDGGNVVLRFDSAVFNNLSFRLFAKGVGATPPEFKFGANSKLQRHISAVKAIHTIRSSAQAVSAQSPILTF